MSETAVVPPVERPPITVVTSENFDEYVASQLPAPVVEETETPEAKAEKELEAVEKQKAENLKGDENEEIDHPEKSKKDRLNQRFSEITAKRKAAEAKAEAAEKAAQAERQAREAAERRAKELQEKYEPPKTDPDPEPQASQFTDINEYSKALKEWTADNTRREDAKRQAEEAAKQERESTVKAWNERQAKYREENPEYDAKIAGSTVEVAEYIQQAILESEKGPQMLEYFADNPEFAAKLKGMKPTQALREFGKIEAKLEAPKETKATPIAEISKAPEPISPLKGASAAATVLSGHQEVPKTMSYEAWKAARLAGKIR